MDAATLQAVGVVIVAFASLVSAIGVAVVGFMNAKQGKKLEIQGEKVDKLIVQTDGLAKAAAQNANLAGQLQERDRAIAADVVQKDKDDARAPLDVVLPVDVVPVSGTPLKAGDVVKLAPAETGRLPARSEIKPGQP